MVRAPRVSILRTRTRHHYRFPGICWLGVHQRHRGAHAASTGDTATLPFLAADMRFMQGVYRGADGKAHQGTFGFI